MELNKVKWDLLFIVFLTGFLLYLTHIEQMELLIQMPFITIYTAYIIGRLVGVNAAPKAKKGENISAK